MIPDRAPNLSPRFRSVLAAAFAIPLLVSCSPDSDSPIGGGDSTVGIPPSLESVLERRFLRVVTSQSSLDYSLVEGRASGFQYAMVEAFVAQLNERFPGELPIRFQFLPVHSDEMIPILRAGRGDMIAARLTITEEREAELLFSTPYRDIDEVIVSGPGVPIPRSHADLAGRSIVVRAGSSHRESLEAIARELAQAGQPPLEIAIAEEGLETEELLVLVAEGEFDLTVTDSMLAGLADAMSLPLKTGLVVRRAGRLAWATMPSAPLLKEQMDAFLPSWQKGSLQGNMAARRYFEQFASFRDVRPGSGPAPLSPYDDLFRRYGERFGFDWYLLAAIAYQESRFQADAKNRSGAVGLFQIKPSTAAEPYISVGPVEGAENVENNIHAAAKYLAWIKQRYFDPNPEMSESDRVRFTLAAYNAGPRAVRLAADRAPARELDPNRWFRNVELTTLTAYGPEPVKYVSEINKRFLAYQHLAER